MKITVEFVLACENKRVKKEMADLEQRLKPYWTKKRFIDDNIYRIEQDNELYREAVEFAENHKKKVQFMVWGRMVHVTEEEREKAAAFIMGFPEHYCEEYEDIINEYKECDRCSCAEKMDNLFYVQPKGYIKKHKNDCGIAGIDGTGEVLLLPKLVEKLISEGIDEKYFQPVLSKRKKCEGYIFVTDNILPEGAIVDPEFKNSSKCPICGHINMETNKQDEYWFSVATISREALDYLHDVNYSYEFFNEGRYIIVSKKVEKIIRENAEGAAFYPLFVKEDVKE